MAHARPSVKCPESGRRVVGHAALNSPGTRKGSAVLIFGRTRSRLPMLPRGPVERQPQSSPNARSYRGRSMDQIQQVRETDQVGRLADAVSEELARMIQSGRLKEGARLPAERDLMQRFGVSRGAVREAI